VKATITLTLDSTAADAFLAALYDGAPDDPPPTALEHFEEHLRGFIEDEMNMALWGNFDDDEPAVLTHVRLTVGGKMIYDEDWSYRADAEDAA
jgi:hypothetical protein